MKYINQGQNFWRRRRSKCKGHRIIEHRFKCRAYWFICLVRVQLVLGEVKEEWDVKNVDMVETYMRIPGACLP
jgi:hypothetical protein